MPRRFLALLFLIGVLSFSLLGCSGGDPSFGTGTVSVYVVNYPLKFFTERIGGEHVKVVFPAPKDEDPAFWMPGAETVAVYQKAELILLNGAKYAKWIDKVSLPQARVCDTSASFADSYIKVKDAVMHGHGPKGKKHAHSGIAFTLWLDPQMAVEQAKTIRDKLAKLRPKRAALFEKNFSSLRDDLEDLDSKIENIVKQAPKQPVLFSHPVYQYFSSRYGINGKSVHWEPDESPTPEMWKELKQILNKHPAKWMIWEGQPKAESVKQLAKLGVQSAVFNPCGNMPDAGNYLDVMKMNVEALSPVYGLKK